MLVTCSSYIFCQYISLGVLDSVKPMILMGIPMTSEQSQCYVTVLEKAHHKKLIISPIQFCTFDPLQGNNAVQEDKKKISLTSHRNYVMKEISVLMTHGT